MNKSDDELDQIAAYCTESGLGREVDLDVYKAKATECVDSGDYKRGIELAINAGLEGEVDSIFYHMILDFIATDQMHDLSLLGEQELTRPFHTICCYLWQMYTAWEQKRFFLGYSALKQLLKLKGIPSNVCLIIILEARKFLESK